MTSLLRVVLAGMLLASSASGCATPVEDGFGIATTLVFDDSVTDDALARVRRLSFVSDEPFDGSLMLGGAPSRIERTVYRPVAAARSLSLTVIGLDVDDVEIASGMGAVAPVHSYLSPELDGEQYWMALNDGSGTKATNSARFIQVKKGHADYLKAAGEVGLGIGHQQVLHGPQIDLGLAAAGATEQQEGPRQAADLGQGFGLLRAGRRRHGSLARGRHDVLGPTALDAALPLRGVQFTQLRRQRGQRDLAQGALVVGGGEPDQAAPCQVQGRDAVQHRRDRLGVALGEAGRLAVPHHALGLAFAQGHAHQGAGRKCQLTSIAQRPRQPAVGRRLHNDRNLHSHARQVVARIVDVNSRNRR